MAEGDLSVRLPAERADELGRLAIAFNQMAASLEQQIDALVVAREREQRFVADVSHELRTPLTALVNESARLHGRLDGLPDTDRRVGEMLVADVGRLSALVEDLLEISRLDSASSEPDLSPIELSRFLEAVVTDRHPDARLSVDASIASVTTDRRSLERVVGNLLDNSRTHAPGAPVAVGVHREDGELCIAVSDQGPGVPAAEIPMLFDRFYKTDSSRQGGSGLGLAIARQHARRAGGELTVRPNVPTGLIFELRLPVTESLHSGDVAENVPVHSEDQEISHPGSTP
jgi:two-component system sensor histidine kinase MtrB